ncbi:S41 family peptidase [Pedobacter nutrimenti]|jgi:C-terminal processing protease CtpA/Prc|uniref:C-terminal processing protease CtpA/Prc n=1 Tax=Pedobacter nutrimenti TaxID=1241337 RepID=A0A318UJ93_9SPHI|nr:S41 family peptidase [Pedobacter nutrimenti]PYF75178.1 C-terminal processing protease CtpA/Prc [Pedobacter nutrimenti]
MRSVTLVPGNFRLYITFVFCVLFGCRKDDYKPDFPSGSNEFINSWVLDSMKVYYYWNSSLPSRPNFNQLPIYFFNGIKNPSDRFSRLINPAVPESYYPSLLHNFGFDLAVYQSGTEIRTVITLVVPGTQAQKEGLKRGDIIKQMNGQQPGAQNAAALIESSIKARKIVLDLEGKGNLNLGAALISENPVYNYRMLDVPGKKIAYLFLNSFEGRSKYDLQKAFAYFNQEQATELIADLRYNPGGDIGMAAVLGAAVAAVAPSDVFVEYRGNANAGNRKSSFQSTIAAVAAGYTFSFSEVQSWRLPLKRVFILTGNHTASAAEFLIKGLRPWIEVVQVGSQTLGKDMASFVIREKDNPAKVGNWSIEPMIFKLYNSQGSGDYPSGLVPDVSADEFALPLLEPGNVNDPLIAAALNRMGGISSSRISSIGAVQRSSGPSKLLFPDRNYLDQSTSSSGVRVKLTQR